VQFGAGDVGLGAPRPEQVERLRQNHFFIARVGVARQAWHNLQLRIGKRAQGRDSQTRGLAVFPRDGQLRVTLKRALKQFIERDFGFGGNRRRDRRGRQSFLSGRGVQEQQRQRQN